MPVHDADIGQAGHLIDDHAEPLPVVPRCIEGRPQPWLERAASVQHESVDQLGDDLPLAGVLLVGTGTVHHVLHGDGLHDRDLRADLVRHDKLGRVARERPRPVADLRRHLRGLGEAGDQPAREVLERDEVAHGSIEAPWPVVERDESIERSLQLRRITLVRESTVGRLDQRSSLLGGLEHGERGDTGVHGILEVMHRVGHVVGPVHDLLLDARLLPGGVGAEPREDGEVIVIGAELAHARLPRPGVLARSIEGGPTEVEADTLVGLGIHDLGLESTEHAEGLGIALEAPDPLREAIELGLTVVAIGRMPQIMGEAGHLDQVGIAPQGRTELAADLGDLQGVGQARAREVRDSRDHDLGLSREAAQRRRVQHACTIPREG